MRQNDNPLKRIELPVKKRLIFEYCKVGRCILKNNLTSASFLYKKKSMT